jgi:predicted SprT family Zn-dependent metalloprotease
MKLWEQLVSASALLLITGATIYGYERESARSLDLQREFDQVNARYFDGTLRANVQWGYLADDHGQTIKGDSSQIIIDRSEFRTVEQIRQTLEHESCHAFVDDDQDNREHGPKFQACMQRFASNPQRND